MQYEILYLIGEPNIAEKDAIDASVEKHITECGAQISEEKWEDRRKLAYPIRHIIRGTFVARRFEVPERDYWSEHADENIQDPVAELTKRLNLMKEILRFTIVRAEGLPSLHDFAARKEEERLRHSQTPRRGSGRGDRDRGRKDTPRKPISSMPFEKKTAKPVEKPEAKPAELAKEDKQPAKDTKDGKEIDEKLDEILNM